MPIFQKSIVNKYLKSLDNYKVKLVYEQFRAFYGNKLRLSESEETITDKFYRDYK